MTDSVPKKRGPKAVTAEHKAAMAVGRNESRSVRLYLEALTANRPKRGRKRTAESIAKRLALSKKKWLPQMRWLACVWFKSV